MSFCADALAVDCAGAVFDLKLSGSNGWSQRTADADLQAGIYLLLRLNVCVITGNLSRDPELAELDSGRKVCRLRVAVNTREMVDGEWSDRPNYFDVSAFGAQRESAARCPSKGRAVAVWGQLRWREWQARGGETRQAVSITAAQVQFLDPPRENEAGCGEEKAGSAVRSEPAPVGGDEDEPPF